MSLYGPRNKRNSLYGGGSGVIYTPPGTYIDENGNVRALEEEKPKKSKAQVTPEAERRISEIAKEEQAASERTARLQKQFEERNILSRALEAPYKIFGAETPAEELLRKAKERDVETRQRLAEERAIVERTGKPIPKPTFGERGLGFLASIPRGGIESSFQAPGTLGIAGREGEAMARRAEAAGKRTTQALGLAQSDAARFDTIQRNLENFGSGLGSMLPYAALELLGQRTKPVTKLAPIAARTAQAVLGSGQGATQARQQMDEFEKQTGQKLDSTTRQLTQLGGGVIGLSEILPVMRMVEVLPPKARQAVTSKVADIATQAAAGRITPEAAKALIKNTVASTDATVASRILTRGILPEAGQEASAQFAQNILEKASYNPEKDVYKDVAANAIMGGLVGGSVRGVTEMAGVLGERAAQNRQKAIEQGALRTEPVTFEVALPDKTNPKNVVRQTLTVIGRDTDGNFNVMLPDGSVTKMTAQDIHNARVPSKGFQSVPLPETLSRDAIGARLVSAIGDTAPDADLGGYIDTVNTRLANNMAVGAADAIETFLKKRRKELTSSKLSEEQKIGRMLVLDEAQKVYDEYLETVTAPPEGAPAQQAPTVEKTATEINTALEEKAKTTQRREDIFAAIINDQTLPDKINAFADALERNGLDGPTSFETAALRDMLRNESDAETAAGVAKERRIAARRVERMNIVEAILYDDRIPDDIKVDRINAALRRKREEPINEEELRRVYGYQTAEAVFGPEAAEAGKINKVEERLRKKEEKEAALEAAAQAQADEEARIEAEKARVAQERADKKAAKIAEARQKLLNRILRDPFVRDRYAAFMAEAERQGFAPPTPEEMAALRGDAAELEALIPEAGPKPVAPPAPPRPAPVAAPAPVPVAAPAPAPVAAPAPAPVAAPVAAPAPAPVAAPAQAPAPAPVAQTEEELDDAALAAGLDEEIDYEEHPLMQEHDAKYDEALEEASFAESVAELRRTAKRLQREGLIDADDYNELDQRIKDAEKEDKLDEGIYALEEILENQRENQREAVEERINEEQEAAAEEAPVAEEGAPLPGGTELAAEETQVEAEPAQVEETTDAQRAEAQELARRFGNGEVVFQEGARGLIRGNNAYSKVVEYYPFSIDDDKVAGIDVSEDVLSFTTGLRSFTQGDIDFLRDVKAQLEAEAEQKHATDPFVKYDADNVAFSPDIPVQLQNVLRGWKKLLLPDEKLYFTSFANAKENVGNFTGPMRLIEGTVSQNSLDNEGNFQRVAQGEGYILFKVGPNISSMLEISAHEMGHAHQYAMFEKLPPEKQTEIFDEHKKWLEQNKGKLFDDYVRQLRARLSGRKNKSAGTRTVDQVPWSEEYWKSFNEWYADQVAKWAVSNEKPLTVVEKFFARLGRALRNFYKTLRGQGFLPTETFAQYMNAVTANLDLTPPEVKQAIADQPTYEDVMDEIEGAYQEDMDKPREISKRGYQELMRDADEQKLTPAEIMDKLQDLRERYAKWNTSRAKALVEEGLTAEQVNQEVVHDQLTSEEKDTIAQHYGQESYNDEAKSRFIDDFVTAVNKGLGAVDKVLRGIIKRIRTAALAVAVVFNPISLSAPPINFDGAAQAIERNGIQAVPLDARANMSDLAQSVYMTMAPVAKANGKAFFIADKPNGIIHAFDADGSYIASSSALYGKAAGDVLSQERLETFVNDPNFREDMKVTPAGKFTMRIIPASDYDGGFTLHLTSDEGVYQSGVAVHSVYNAKPAENRLGRLASAEAGDNKVSFGCINTEQKFFLEKIVPNQEKFDGGMVFVLPDNVEQTPQMFKGDFPFPVRAPSAPKAPTAPSGPSPVQFMRRRIEVSNNPDEDVLPAEQDLEDTIGTLEQAFPASVNRPRRVQIAVANNMRGKLEKIYDDIATKLDWKYRGAQNYTRALASSLGITKLPDNMDVLSEYALLESRKIGAQMRLAHTFVNRIENEIIRLVDEGVHPQDIGMFFWARAAADRNAMVKKRTEGEIEDGSGLSNAEAQAALNDLAVQGILPKLKNIAKMHDQLVDYMLNEKVKAGLLSKEQRDRVRKEQPFYSPLKGYAYEGDMQVDGDPEVNSGMDYAKGKKARGGVRLQEWMRTNGRDSAPFNPLYNLMSDAQFAMARIENNKVGEVFLNNILRDPISHKDIVQVYTAEKTPATQALYDKGALKLLYTKEAVDNMNKRARERDVFVVKKNGETYYLDFENTSAGVNMTRAFRNMTPRELPIIMRGIQAVSNGIKSSFTRFSLPYTLTVATIRDYTEAVFTNYVEQGLPGGAAEGKKIAARSLKYIRSMDSANVIRRYLSGTEPKTEDQEILTLLFDQFLQDGGVVGQSAIQDVDTRASNIAAKIKRYSRLKNFGFGTPTAAIGEVKDVLLDALDVVAQTQDIQARFATYRAALDAGISRRDAAKLALNSSLDLTRRGEWAPYVDAYIFFASATKEGGRKIINQGSKGAAKLFAKAVVMGAMLYLWNSLIMGGDDDDDGRPNILEVNSATAQSRIILRTGHGIDDYRTIPVAFGLAYFPYVGGQIMAATLGDISPEEAATNIVSGFINLASPIKAERSTGMQETIAKASPDLAQPFADIAINRTAFGSPIYVEQQFKAGPRSDMGREETGEGWKLIAKGLSRVTGGTSTEGGRLDMQPEIYRYLVQQYLGGLYSAPADLAKSIFSEPRPDETFVQRAPFIKTFFGKGGNYAPMNKFYKYTTKSFGVSGMQPDMDNIYSKYVNNSPNSAEWKQTRKDHPLESDPKLIRKYGDTIATLRALRRYYRAGGYGDDKKAYLNDLNAAYEDFNRTYAEVKKKYD